MARSFAHCNGEAEGLEAGLVHPGGEHGAGEFALLSGNNV